MKDPLAADAAELLRKVRDDEADLVARWVRGLRIDNYAQVLRHGEEVIADRIRQREHRRGAIVCTTRTPGLENDLRLLLRRAAALLRPLAQIDELYSQGGDTHVRLLPYGQEWYAKVLGHLGMDDARQAKALLKEIEDMDRRHYP
jgi:hypothetical protein